MDKVGEYTEGGPGHGSGSGISLGEAWANPHKYFIEETHYKDYTNHQDPGSLFEAVQYDIYEVSK